MPFIAKLPLKVFKVQEEVKRLIHDSGRSMLIPGAHERKGHDLLSTMGSYVLYLPVDCIHSPWWASSAGIR